MTQSGTPISGWDDCRYWQLCPGWKHALCAAPKCGSSTLAYLVVQEELRFLQATNSREDRVAFKDVPGDYKTVAFIRDPVTRWWSLYNAIRQGLESRQPIMRELAQMTPSEYLVRVKQLGLNFDIHFYPQVRFDVDAADELVPTERMSEWWAKNKPPGAGDMPHKRKGDLEKPHLPEIEAEVRKLYPEDTRLWQRVHNNLSRA